MSRAGLLGFFILAGLAVMAACTPAHPGTAVSQGDSGNGSHAAVIQRLSAITASLPSGVRDRILARPEPFLVLLREVLAESPILVTLVDKEHALPADYAPADLIRLRDYRVTINRNDLELRKEVMGDLMRMVRAARTAHVELALSSTYRSYAYQKKVFAMNVAQLGLKEAERESAVPGTSQHQLGTTIDFGSITPAFADTAAGRWLESHAWEYGFTMSYPNGYENLTGYIYEPWHFRYIGIPAAQMERDYFDGIQQRLLVFLHDHRPALSALAGR
ncbi:MAG TPA: M15 family metallopeptidase [Spirochaetia bacterium]|nr:M15 family metallopeptidase [Spirochaetia bacterium]